MKVIQKSLQIALYCLAKRQRSGTLDALGSQSPLLWIECTDKWQRIQHPQFNPFFHMLGKIESNILSNAYNAYLICKKKSLFSGSVLV